MKNLITFSTSSKIFTFLALLFVLLNLSKQPFNSNFALTIGSISLLLFIWISLFNSLQISKSQYFFLGTLLILFSLLFSINWNKSIIQLLWDTFIESHGIHPYLYYPSSSEIAKALQSQLFQFLDSKNAISSTPIPLLIAFKPLYWLYKQIGFAYSIISIKIIIGLIYVFFVYQVSSKNRLLFWLFNPIIWIFGISQGDVSIFGFILFLFGIFSYMQKLEEQAYAIWGIVSLFGFEYVLLLIGLFVILEPRKKLIYFFISAFIWVGILWDFSAYYTFLFNDNLRASLFYRLIPHLTNYYLILSLFSYFFFCIWIFFLLVYNRTKIAHFISDPESKFDKRLWLFFGMLYVTILFSSFFRIYSSSLLWSLSSISVLIIEIWVQKKEQIREPAPLKESGD